jgi:hypothetical protein
MESMFNGIKQFYGVHQVAQFSMVFGIIWMQG